MEKLIELLDLYRKENKTEELFWEPWTLVPLTWKDFIMLNRVMIISKEYGFIKWLVDNDKIDYHNKINYDISLAINRVLKKTTREERLLMMLAIQDEPIEFLISILK